MKTSQTGINLIKSFEGVRLTAYKAVSTEKYYTIGYGHYGADVTKGMKITQAQADAYLVSDLAKFEAKVNKYMSKYNFNSNQFDSLVSFAYNVGNIDGLTANGTRTIAQISSKFSAYNKSGGKVLAGLTKRRAAEKKLFDTPVATPTVYGQAQFIADVEKILGVTTTSAALNKSVTLSATKNKNHALVTPLERYMKSLGYYNGTIEADNGKTPSLGPKMTEAIKTYQKNIVKSGIVDGIISAKGYTWKKLLRLS